LGEVVHHVAGLDERGESVLTVGLSTMDASSDKAHLIEKEVEKKGKRR